MNYRHAFHAGNHTEVFKHAALILILQHLARKPQGFVVLDTHAGLGAYDLLSEAARKTLEYEAGAAKVFGQSLPSAPAYVDLLTAMNPVGLITYPGSPEIARRLLRPQDRLIACELHPADVDVLRARYGHDPQVGVHHRDGYEAIGAFTPPPERRGLVFIDPPYERTDEAAALVQAVTKGLRKWPTGIFMAWYPIKDRAIADALSDAAVAAPFPKTLRAEFQIRPRDDQTLTGGGIIVCNAPWKLDEQLAALGDDLARLLGTGEASCNIGWLTPS
jgi:23S rRNA (adenine2030-N6)-methyltransferase